MSFPVTALHPAFPGYLIYSDGTVESRIHSKPRKLSPCRMGEYWGFTLVNQEGKLQRIYLHRLVAETFLGPCPPGQETRHIDGNKMNNAASNLKWGTRAQNMRDKETHGTAPIGERHGRSRLKQADVLEMRRLRKEGASLPDLMARFGVSRMTCWRAATGRSWAYLNKGVQS